MTFQHTDRYADRADPEADLRKDRYLASRRGGPTAMWIVAGLVVLIAILAIWGGAFDSGGPAATNTTTPPAAEAPMTPPTPAPAPAQ